MKSKQLRFRIGALATLVHFCGTIQTLFFNLYHF